MKSTNLVVVGLLLVFALSALWLSRRSASPPDEQIVDVVLEKLQTTEGRKEIQGLYESHCTSCHGDDLRGRNPGVPTLFSERMQKGGPLVIAQRIVEGGRGMPSFQGILSKQQLLELSLWIRFKIVDAHSGQSSPPSSIPPVSFEISGKIKVGEAGQKFSSSPLFLLAKANPEMKGPPLLVRKLDVLAEQDFILDSSHLMMGSPPAVGTTLYIVARIDTDGNPMTSSGEPTSEVLPVIVQEKLEGVRIKIN